MGGLVNRQSQTTIERKRLRVSGIVQGVGFRPTVYNLAIKHKLTGFVQNRSGEVVIEIEGNQNNMNLFTKELKCIKRPAYISSIEETQLKSRSEKEFLILESEKSIHAPFIFPADLKSCNQCNKEVLEDELSRFYQYPFTSCTYCGPRYSTIRGLPYDRDYTSMHIFTMCPQCQAEYSSPNDRRFHAQTIACPQCGPSITIFDQIGNKINENWLDFTTDQLVNGKIFAVKGLGGFHLVCNTRKKETIKLLRQLKQRPQKPLALMAANIEIIKEYFHVSGVEEKALTAPSAPIVLLKPKSHTPNVLPLSAIAPGLQRIGIMLPYTPLHALLIKSLDFIVATSGNKSGHPMAHTNEEATKLNGIADFFLLHDREITIRVDDSVGQVIEDRFVPIRRSRGVVPETLLFPLPVKSTRSKMPIVLGAGAEMKNTFCYLFKGEALFSQHIGDINNIEHLDAYANSIQHFSKLLDLQPEIIAYDPHPDYLVSKKVKEKPGVKAVPVYHHHAHMASCMAENMIQGPVIGCILDGTGYGKDGTMWGFEILTGDYVEFERIQHLNPIILPGGDKGIKNPWMVGLSLIYESSKDRKEFTERVKRLFPYHLDQLPILLAQLEGTIPSPKVSSAGRLFDGVASLLGLCEQSTYEGEAAVQLSEVMEAPGIDSAVPHTSSKNYPFFSEDGKWIISDIINGIIQDLDDGIPKTEIALKFHHTIGEMIHEGVENAYRKTGITDVVLSGGVWNNRYLFRFTKFLLQESGFTVHTHQKIPCGDGGIALGQAVSALWRWKVNHVSVHTS